MAINHNHIRAMILLAAYYEKVEKNINLAKKYYLMTAYEKDTDSINDILSTKFDAILAIK